MSTSDQRYSGDPRARFRWTTFDVERLLHDTWRVDILRSAEHESTSRVLSGRHGSSREGANPEPIEAFGVSGTKLALHHKWLSDLYRTTFRELAEDIAGEPVFHAQEEKHGAVLNVQFNNGVRYECHVDTNPIEGLLFVTDHPRGTGGELVVSNSLDAKDTASVDKDCSIIRPESGKLVFFDGRRHPHYVRPLMSAPIRVVVAMNFYTHSSPEQSRPHDLDEYLYGQR